MVDRSRGSRSKAVSRYRAGEIASREIDALQNGLGCRELVAFFVELEVTFVELQLDRRDGDLSSELLRQCWAQQTEVLTTHGKLRSLEPLKSCGNQSRGKQLHFQQVWSSKSEMVRHLERRLGRG